MDWRALSFRIRDVFPNLPGGPRNSMLMGLVLVFLMPILVLWSDQALSTPPALGFSHF